ncbi:SGNH/GDSL hydrolase family protein [uncultured Algibacter sp.]|uniref:SGNH/GDSL hydrolase family protein n=1 Tax=uncultured Algibacter sp. TaxID=298659 RepID=UPI002615777F|nr:SGNH/GDSL hydrolase family protein [uncultured Algibacter sp.]
MKFISTRLCLSLVVFMLFACTKNPDEIIPEKVLEIIIEEEENELEYNNPEIKSIKLLALGDSYTIGQSVCQTCRFPEQLKSRLIPRIEFLEDIELQVIAKTGWTTTNLIDAISTNELTEDYNLVTLLIGVNNQYQGKPFSIYQSEFPQLVNTAIKKANSKKNNVIVISIPDYAFTPFGKGRTSISQDLDRYNNFAQNYCLQNNISFVYITDITRQGLTNPNLVASDGLHPSELAYAKFVDRLLPLAIKKLEN